MIGHERPRDAPKKTEGMPSSHAAALCYWLCTVATLLQRRSQQSPATLLAATAAMAAYVAVVLYARTRLTRAHNLPQVAAGAAVGVAFSLLWDIGVGLN